MNPTFTKNKVQMPSCGGRFSRQAMIWKATQDAKNQKDNGNRQEWNAIALLKEMRSLDSSWNFINYFLNLACQNKISKTYNKSN